MYVAGFCNITHNFALINLFNVFFFLLFFTSPNHCWLPLSIISSIALILPELNERASSTQHHCVTIVTSTHSQPGLSFASTWFHSFVRSVNPHSHPSYARIEGIETYIFFIWIEYASDINNNFMYVHMRAYT